MTVHDDVRSPLEQALDLIVFLPVGFVLELPRSVPRFIQRGREQFASGTPPLDLVQQHAHRTLRALGIGTTDVEAGHTGGPMRSPAAPTTPHRGTGAEEPEASSSPVPPIRGGTAPSLSTRGRSTPGQSNSIEPASPEPPSVPTIDPAALAIPGYDSLSASQVVPRLESLTGDELEQVRLYELSNRGRKTILSKVAQLQG